MLITIKTTFLPAPGRTSKFMPTLSYDIAVTDVYTLGSLPLNIAPQPIVSARLENLSPCGDITLDVTLNVSGAKTYSDVKSVTIPAGFSTIANFSNYNPTVEGIDTIIVSVPADVNNVNNARGYRQEVTKNSMNYADNSIPNGQVSLQFTGLMLTRYIIPESRKVNAVNVFISNDVNTVGKTMYAAVVDESGAIIGSSNNGRLR